MNSETNMFVCSKCNAKNKYVGSGYAGSGYDGVQKCKRCGAEYPYGIIEETCARYCVASTFKGQLDIDDLYFFDVFVFYAPEGNTLFKKIYEYEFRATGDMHPRDTQKEAMEFIDNDNPDLRRSWYSILDDRVGVAGIDVKAKTRWDSLEI